MARTKGLNLAKAKKQNDITIMDILYKYGPITRHQIADMMGMSIPSITTNIATLVKNGVAEEIDGEDENENAIGRKAKPVDLCSTYRYFLGVEITPVRCTFCLTDLRFRNVELKEVYRNNANYDSMIAFVAETLLDIIANHEKIRDRILGVGVGVPGFVEREPGVVRSMGRFNWHNKPLREDLEKKIHLPVRVENNGRVRVIGEDTVNGSFRPDTFAYFFVSLGIACPLLIKNSLLTGSSAGAGEIGHMIMQEENGPKCEMCGKRGCLDSLASETAIINSCKAAMEAGRASVLRRNVESNGRMTMNEIISAQSGGDPDVRSIIQRAVRYLAIAVANMANLITPDLVIVDAYIMKLQENRDLFLRIVKEYLFGINENEIQIEFKEYDRFAGCKSAAAYAIRHFFIRGRR